MTQPIKLQLNTEAVTALFPEGSQARVELQAAVVAEFVRKHFKEHALGTNVFATIERARNDALDAVKRARQDLMDDALKGTGLQKDWNRFTLVGDARQTVKDAAISAIRTEAAKAASEAVDGIKTDIDVVVQRRIEAIADAEIRAAVRRHIDAVMASMNKLV